MSRPQSAEVALTPAARPRFHWMDLLRGWAILMVMAWHATAIPVRYGAAMPWPIRDANMFFLPYRMPTLMFLSGLLLPASMRKSIPVYYAGKFAMIVWPYLLWVTLDRAIHGGPHPWWHWRSWYATSYLWFLFFIGVYYFIAPLIRRLPVWLPIVAFAAVSFLLPPGMEKRLTYFAIFFFAGRLVAGRPDRLARCTRAPVVWVLGAAALVFGAFSAVLRLRLAYHAEYAAASLAGVCALIAIAQALQRRGIALRWLTRVGQNSIVYYCSHFPIMTGVMYGLYALGVHNILVVSLANLPVALLSGSLLVRYRTTRPITWLFQAPAVLTDWVKRRDRAAGPARRATPVDVAAGPGR